MKIPGGSSRAHVVSDPELFLRDSDGHAGQVGLTLKFVYQLQIS